MKKEQKKSDSNLREERLLCGLFSRKHGAQFISSGIAHVHSTLFGSRDVCVQETKQALNTDKIPVYSWERQEKLDSLVVEDSHLRIKAIEKIVEQSALQGKKRLTDRVKIVLEELVTNGFYHAYLNDRGLSKYHRTDHVQLTTNEKIHIEYAISNDGILICVKDQGGTLTFSEIASALTRCYEKGETQIEQKDSGAGLGTYFILEAVSHLKVVVDPGVSTTVSCWISDRPTSQHSDTFSFNYFEKRKA